MCRGLSAIDTDLVEGFTATVDAVHGQARILDSRIFQVGKAIVGQMEQENHLTRGTIQEVGRHFVDAIAYFKAAEAQAGLTDPIFQNKKRGKTEDRVKKNSTGVQPFEHE
ncbi:MAG: hypothetical protein A2097_12615 [Desulfobacula sp. GWF2_41_7]|nr:MAG: hypothetical protein A2097_12615 [Desulfobacula sp. GWF2_41_7]